MKLNHDDLIKLSQVAENAAKEAGYLISSYIDRSVQTSFKAAGSSAASQVVTEVDHLCDALIRKHLSGSVIEYDLALLTEEQEDDKQRLQKDYFWCIDPLDGTLAFIEGIQGYAVSIALVSNSGEALIGVVFDPANKVLYSAIKGQGAFRNGNVWSLPATPVTPNKITIPIDRSLLAREDFKILKSSLSSILKENGYNELQFCHHAGAVMNACWALEQTPSCYFKLPKPQQGGGSLWDFAATSCLFQALNLPVYDAFGKNLDLNKAHTTYMNESGVIFASSLELVQIIQTWICTD